MFRQHFLSVVFALMGMGVAEFMISAGAEWWVRLVVYSLAGLTIWYFSQRGKLAREEAA